MGLRWRCLQGELSRRCAYEAVELICITHGARVCTEHKAYRRLVLVEPRRRRADRVLWSNQGHLALLSINKPRNLCCKSCNSNCAATGVCC